MRAALRARFERPIRRRRGYLGAALLCLLLATPCEAQPLNLDRQCGDELEVSASLLDRFTPSHASPATDGVPSFVAGTLEGDTGQKLAALFVEGPQRWAGYAIQQQAGFTNVYVSSSSKRALLFSMIDVEGPGQSYTVVSTDDGFQHIACGELPAPATELDTLDYMSLTSLDLAVGGYGLLRGRVDFGGERAPACFSAETKDGGKTWSVPKAVEPCIASVVNPVDQVPPADDPVSALRSSVK